MFGFASSIHDLSEMACTGKLEPAYGRDLEVAEVLRMLSRVYSKSVLVVGPKGAGKTRFVRGVVLEERERVEKLGVSGLQFLELTATVMRSRTVRIRDAVLALIRSFKSNAQQILVADDAFPLLDPREDPFSPAGLLSAAIKQGDVWCVATMTTEEYESFAGLDPAGIRTFRVVQLRPFPEERTLEELKRLVPQLERDYRVKINEATLRRAVRLTQEYLPDEALPGKAITVLTQACALCRQRLDTHENVDVRLLDSPMQFLGNSVSSYELKCVVAKRASVDVFGAELDRWKTTRTSHMKTTVFGQDAAIEHMISVMANIRDEYQRAACPAGVLLFGGPPGSGKVHAAKALTYTLMQSYNEYMEFSLGEGPDPRVIARLLKTICDKDLTPEISGPEDAERPAALRVVVIKGIERAHPNVLGPLLRIVTHDCSSELMCATPPTHKCLFIFTLNVDPRRTDMRNPGWLRDLLNSLVRREIVDRFNAIVPFGALDAPSQAAIVMQAMNEVRNETALRGIQVVMENEVVRLVTERGYTSEGGASDLLMTFQRLVVEPLYCIIKADILPQGSAIDIFVRDGRVVVCRRDAWKSRRPQGAVQH